MDINKVLVGNNKKGNKTTNDANCENLALNLGIGKKLKNRKRKHREMETSVSESEHKLNKISKMKKKKNKNFESDDNDALLKANKKFKIENFSNSLIEDVTHSSKGNGKSKLSEPNSSKLHEVVKGKVKRKNKRPLKKKDLNAVPQEGDCHVKDFKSFLRINTVESQTDLGIDLKKARKLKKKMNKSAERNVSSDDAAESIESKIISKKIRRQKKKAERASAEKVEQKEIISPFSPAYVGKQQEQKISKKKKREMEPSIDMESENKAASSDIKIKKRRKRDNKSLSGDESILDIATLKANKKSKIDMKSENKVSSGIKIKKRRKRENKSLTDDGSILAIASLKANKKSKIDQSIKHQTVGLKEKVISKFDNSSPQLGKVLERKVRRNRNRSRNKTSSAVSQEEFCVNDLKSVIQINTSESQTELGLDMKKARKLRKRMRKFAKRIVSSDEATESNNLIKRASKKKRSKRASSEEGKQKKNISSSIPSSGEEPGQILTEKKSRRKNRRKKVISSLLKDKDAAILSIKKKNRGEIPSVDKKKKKNREEVASSDVMKNRNEAVPKKRKRNDECSSIDLKNREESKEQMKKRKILKETPLNHLNTKIPSLDKDAWRSEKISDSKKSFSQKVLSEDKEKSVEYSSSGKLMKKKLKKNKAINKEVISNLEINEKKTKKGKKHMKEVIDDQTSHTRETETSEAEDKTVKKVKKLKKRRKRREAAPTKEHSANIVDQSDSDIICEPEDESSVDNYVSKRGNNSDADEASGHDSDIVECDEDRPMFSQEEVKVYHQFQLKEINETNSRKVKTILSNMKHNGDEEICAEDQKSFKKSSKKKGSKSPAVQTDMAQALYMKNGKLTETNSNDSKQQTKNVPNDTKQCSKDVPEPEDLYGSDDDDDLQIIYDTIEKDCINLSTVKKELPCEDDIESQQLGENFVLPKNSSSEKFVSSIFNLYNKSDVLYKSPEVKLVRELKAKKLNNINNSNIKSQKDAIVQVPEIEVIEQLNNDEEEEITRQKGDHVINNCNKEMLVNDHDDYTITVNSVAREVQVFTSDVEDKKKFSTDIDRSKNENECSVINRIKDENNEEVSDIESEDEICILEDIKQSSNDEGNDEVSFSNEISNMGQAVCINGLESSSSQNPSHDIPETNAHSNSEGETTSEISNSQKKRDDELKSISVPVYSDHVNTSKGTEEINNSSKDLLQDGDDEVFEDNSVDDLTLKMDESLNDSTCTVIKKLVKPSPGLSHKKVLKFDKAATCEVKDLPVVNGLASEASPLQLNSQNKKLVLNENKENIVDNKQKGDLDTSSVAAGKDCNQETNGLVMLKQKSTPRSASKIRSKRASMDKSNISITLTPLKVSNAALANEIIISPQVSDEENAVVNVETDSDSILHFVPDDELNSKACVEEQENKENMVDNKQEGDLDTTSVTAEKRLSLSKSEEVANSSFESLKHLATPRSSSRRKSKRTSREKTDIITLTPLKVSNAALENEIVISPQVGDEEIAPLVIEDVKEESKSSPSPTRRSPRLSTNIQKPSSNEKLNEKASTTKKDLASEDESEERDKVLSPVMPRYSLRRGRNPVTPEKPTVTTPRLRRSSLSSIISEESEAKLPASPVRPRSRRSSLSGCLTPVRRSRRISGLHEPIEEEK